MNRILIVILIISTKIFSQSDSKESFEIIKRNIEQSQIDLKKIDIVDKNLNDTELKLLKLISSNNDEFNNKEITFITGSAGTIISSKATFFKSFLEYYYEKELIIPHAIIKLDEKQRLLSDSDYLIFFWSKTYNPKSKKLLKKIKQTKHT